ncbi:pyridoxal-phosphate-dependent aminotransferase family protein [Paractinoplanes rishiriensis]|uniref:Serine-pyruvate aminotransferase n=1 Tax=Paractinoplanes rishiriensis TaxID=1050105 RepID=A0A919K583_9ACTN|nr:alanine--glyoxylate aminotransferase family protein [Actinoplanes rishiriensis]GIE99527.1 serine-pyruvate aminotransferase [Actinoplanes rishiriensis]
MRHKYRLMVPGPTTMPPEVIAAGALPVFDERIPRFAELFRQVRDNLRAVFRTRNDVLVFASSMTGAMESVLQNAFSPGDRVLVAVNGFFAQRWADMCRAHGLAVTVLPVPWGEPVDPARVSAALAAHPDVVGAVGVHCETSTGALSDLRGFAAVTGAAGVLSVVDAASSLGADELRTDEWGVDVVVGGGQKALMTPAGLSFVTVSERAWDAHRRSTGARYYFDWTATRDAVETRGATPFTPAVSLIVQLDVALTRILAEGLPQVWARHEKIAGAVRAGLEALGLRATVAAEHASGAVTGAWLPDGLDGTTLVARLLDDYGVQITGGLGPQAGRVIRVGHCGYVDMLDAVATLAALEQALADCGHVAAPGAGVTAARRTLNGAGVLR